MLNDKKAILHKYTKLKIFERTYSIITKTEIKFICVTLPTPSGIELVIPLTE